MRLRIPVTIETPTHQQRFVLVREWHLVDAAMAFNATDAFVHVNTVVKVGKLGQVVDSLPCDRRARSIAGSHKFQGRRANPDLLVAIHADFRRRNSREGR